MATVLERAIDVADRWGGEPALPASLAGLPPVIGHRGAAGAAPENTLASIRKAQELGATWVEFDVKLTRDGHPILKHDDRLERTTDGRGKVAETTLAEIKRLDAGGWFHPSFRGERVPTLEEALALCVELGLGVNVEIKPCPGREIETARVAVEQLLRLWPGAMPAPLVSSFATPCLAVSREIAPEVPRGYLAHPLPRRWREELERYGCATLHLNHRWIGARRRAAIIASGVPLVLFTINGAARARQHLESGVAAVITDHVDRIAMAVRSDPARRRGGRRPE
jgi:glycerophosphoryl diester phosphodiesterase